MSQGFEEPEQQEIAVVLAIAAVVIAAIGVGLAITGREDAEVCAGVKAGVCDPPAEDFRVPGVAGDR